MPPIRRTSSGTGPTSSRKIAGRPDRRATETSEVPEPYETPGRGLGLTRRLRRRSEGVDTGLGRGTGSTATRDGSGDADVPARRSTGLRVLGAAGLVAGVALGVIGGLTLHDPEDPPVGEKVDNVAFIDDARTDEVKEAATTDVQRLVAIDHASLDQYHDALPEILQPELIEQLDKNWPTLKDTYTKTKLKVDAKVTNIGVTFLQGDRAEALVVQDVSTTRDGQASGSTTGTYLVTLEKVDGAWKLSKIPDLPS